ncbi:hypothetical protein [Nocardia cyriacigeorgica]|uniref:hypothetical protein n=1 Tax=Nocardia cyriacigeorgica TaxID=135487 RepID=UPI001893658F|nr:hypothetical protein [Nocardia cyriacigeorgica]MBF6095428.1 hypothetical protein [Nocardia cyriacigeorgica]
MGGAVDTGDSQGKHRRDVQILNALERDRATATAAELVEVLAYRAELAIRAGDTAAAVAALERARAITLIETEGDTVAESLAALADIELGLHSPRMP